MRANHWKGTIVVAVAALSFVAVGCGSGLQGTYSSTNGGTMMLELRSGGKAAFTMLGETKDCTYTVGGKDVHLNCDNHELDFRIMDDGSLNNVPLSAAWGALKKTK
ncbi:MAG: hypothetical protein ACRD5K_06480 [Candidatus Acidiferrales bacterium]